MMIEMENKKDIQKMTYNPNTAQQPCFKKSEWTRGRKAWAMKQTAKNNTAVKPVDNRPMSVRVMDMNKDHNK